MQPLFLADKDVEGLTSVGEAIGVIETAFRQQATGEAANLPRHRLATERTFLHLLAGAVPGYFGYKVYTTGAGKRPRFLFYLYDARTAALVAVMDADRLGQIRTGAATGLATRLLAREDSEVATLIGAGWQAQSQLLAMDTVRKLRRVYIVNRTPEKAEKFMELMAPQVKAELEQASSREAAVGESHIVTTITASREPVLLGKWLKSGTHVNAAGANMLMRREVDADVIFKADRIVVDSIEQAHIECGELLPVLGHGRRHWDEVQELKDVVRAGPRRRNSEEITLFKSQGIGLEDVALAALVYERARDQGVGRVLNL
jgi:alanine dehydrogenase